MLAALTLIRLTTWSPLCGAAPRCAVTVGGECSCWHPCRTCVRSATRPASNQSVRRAGSPVNEQAERGGAAARLMRLRSDWIVRLAALLRPSLSLARVVTRRERGWLSTPHCRRQKNWLSLSFGSWQPVSPAVLCSRSLHGRSRRPLFPGIEVSSACAAAG